MKDEESPSSRKKTPGPEGPRRPRRLKGNWERQVLAGRKAWEDDEHFAKRGPMRASSEGKPQKRGPATAGRGQPETPDAAQGQILEAHVLEIHSEWCVVQVGGETWRCRPRGKLRELPASQMPVVGDRVRLEQTSAGEGMIHEVLARRNEVARRRLRHQAAPQVIAANVDQLVVVSSVKTPPLWPGIIDRYLAVASGSDMSPLICINKVDLDEGQEAPGCSREYENLGYPVVLVSAQTGTGLESLRERLKGKTSAFVGQSGVGKSSLLNALEPSLNLRTGELNQATKKGRHVTTSARLLVLSIGAYVVDTPGVRAFDPFELSRLEVEAGFPEIAKAADGCRFPDCQHVQEPGCVVREAVVSGIILERRYQSYRSILQSVMESGNPNRKRN